MINTRWLRTSVINNCGQRILRLRDRSWLSRPSVWILR